jgi:glycosyltransferase involved in cell wall biosynthesis
MATDPLRVLHLSTWKVPCGIASYCANLVKSLEAEGVVNDVHPLKPHEWQTYLPQDVAQWQSDIVSHARDFDVVHIQHEHGFFGCSRGNQFAVKRYGELVRALRASGKPVATTFHTEINPGAKRVPRFFRKIKGWFRTLPWRRRVVPQFGSQAGQARAILHTHQTRFIFAEAGFPLDAIHVVPHPCLPQRTVAIDREAAKIKLGISRHSTLLTIFGFVGAYKGHDIALEALKWLPEKYHLAIVGGAHPEARDEFLHNLLSNVNRKMRPRVTITGYVENEVADAYYAATDICLAPYRPFANLSASGAITWALSSGRPTIASKIDAFQAIQRDAECLFMVTPEKVRELAWAVEKLDRDAALQQRLVANALQYCEKHSWGRSARGTIAIYEQMLGRQVRPQLHVVGADAA